MKFLVLLNRQIDDGDDDNDYFQELTELVRVNSPLILSTQLVPLPPPENP